MKKIKMLFTALVLTAITSPALSMVNCRLLLEIDVALYTQLYQSGSVTDSQLTTMLEIAVMKFQYCETANAPNRY